MAGLLRVAVAWSLNDDRGIYVITVPPDRTLQIVDVLAPSYRLLAIVAGTDVVRMQIEDRMSDKGPSRVLSEPRPGFFKMRRVRGGPFVGAEIRHGPAPDPDTGEPLDRSWLWEALVNGKHEREPAGDPLKAGVIMIWESATEITEREYRFLIADAEWCAKHAPDEPQAKPTEKVSIVDLPPSHFLPH